jgi:hypothetical protein
MLWRPRDGKVLLNGPFANSINDFGSSLFGAIVIAAIFGTSIPRDFQRDTYQILFTKRHLQVRLPRRTLGRLLRHHRLRVLRNDVRQILYTLADYIGEDKLNLALHNFLM